MSNPSREDLDMAYEAARKAETMLRTVQGCEHVRAEVRIVVKVVSVMDSSMDRRPMYKAEQAVMEDCPGNFGFDFSVRVVSDANVL